MKKVFVWMVIAALLLTFAACEKDPKPTSPSMQVTDPTTQPTDPSVQPTDPSVQPTDPSVQPTDPIVQPTDPTVQPTNPPEQPTEPTNKVTIYIPDTTIIYDATGAVVAEVTYVFEEGWQEMETFTVLMDGNVDVLGGACEMVYSEKHLLQDVSNGAKAEIFYDENGRTIKMINHYANGGHREVYYTYDADGKNISQEDRMYESANAEPVTILYTYDYVYTGDVYTVTTESNGMKIISTYNKDGRQISQVAMLNDREISKTEAAYDEAGNMISQVSYSNGQKTMEAQYNWKMVEVSQDTADRLPQFKKAN